VLDSYYFDEIEDVREVTATFINDYNNYSQHDSLAGLAPISYRNVNQGILNIFVKGKQKKEGTR